MDNPITIKKANADLPIYTESWRLSSYREKKMEFYNYMQTYRGHSPSGNMVFMRYISFPVTIKIKLLDLIELGYKLKERFHIECFQIAIDREKGVAYMLCNWYDKETDSCVYFYESKFMKLVTLIVHTLDLNIQLGNNTIDRCILNEEYNENNEVFNEVENWVKQSNPTAKTYKILKHSLQYVKNKMEGLTK